MKRCLAAFATVAIVGSAAASGDAPELPEPFILAQVKSPRELGALLDRTVDSHFREDWPGRVSIRSAVWMGFLTERAAGIDPAKPIGLYLLPVPDWSAQGVLAPICPVALIPVSDEKVFLATMKSVFDRVDPLGDRDADRRKSPGYRMESDAVPTPLFLRFADGHAYVSLSLSSPLRDGSRLKPGRVIRADEKSAVAVRWHIDMTPGFLKELQVKGAGAGLESLRDSFPDSETVADIDRLWRKLLRRWVEDVTRDASMVTYRLDLDPETAEIRFEFGVEPKPGTELARQIASMKPTRNAFASLAGEEPAAELLLRLPLFAPELRQIFGRLATEMEAIFQLRPDPMRAANLEFARMLKRTVESGDMDLAACLRKPDAEGRFTGVFAGRLKDTAPYDRAWRKLVSDSDDPATELIRIAKHRLGQVPVHELAFGELFPPQFSIAFGEGNLLAALAPNRFYLTLGPEGLAVIREALKAEPKAAPVLKAEVSLRRLAPMLTAFAPDIQRELRRVLAPDVDRVTLAEIDVSGGERLAVGIRVSGLPFAYWLASEPRICGED